MMATGFWWVLLGVAVYGFLHSFLASHTAKGWAERALGAAARRFYRLFYILIALAGVVPLLLLARFLPDKVIFAFTLPWSLLLMLLQGLAGLGLIAAVSQTDPWAFIGLRQIGTAPALRAQPGSEDQAGKLVTTGLYQRVRHPIYTFSLLAIWLVPMVSWNLLAMMIGLTLYIFVGIYFEERKLVAEFGHAYTLYRGRTPVLLPKLFK
jgi:protein-S-isoprenylcysteine O-methyltransferase Ste14